MSSDYEIPRRLDDPPKVLWWDWDQAMLVMAFMLLGILANSFFIATFFGVWAAYFFSKAKSGRHPAFAVHLMYWFLPSDMTLKLKRTPPSHIREFIG